jgi:putative transposase
MFKRILQIAVEEVFPVQARGRPPLLDFDNAYEDILHVIRTGMQWRQLRSAAGVSYITVFKTMRRWVKADLFHVAYQRLLRLYRRRRRPRYCCVDSSFVKNIYGIDCVGRNPTDRGRKATKLSAAVDDTGIPYSLLCSPGNQSDMRLLHATLEAAIVPTPSGTPLYADKGYDSAANRRTCIAFGYRDRLFRRRTVNGRRTHAKRGVVERFFSWLDKYRRLIMRYERYVATYMGMTYMACGRLLEARVL